MGVKFLGGGINETCKYESCQGFFWERFLLGRETWQRQFGETLPGKGVTGTWHILQVKEGAQLHSSFEVRRQLTL